MKPIKQSTESNSMRNRFTLILNRFTLILNRFTLIRNRFTLVQNRFTLVQNRFTPIQNRFTLVLNRFTLVLNRFTLVLNRLPFVPHQSYVTLEDPSFSNFRFVNQKIFLTFAPLNKGLQKNKPFFINNK